MTIRCMQIEQAGYFCKTRSVKKIESDVHHTRGGRWGKTLTDPVWAMDILAQMRRLTEVFMAHGHLWPNQSKRSFSWSQQYEKKASGGWWGAKTNIVYTVFYFRWAPYAKISRMSKSFPSKTPLIHQKWFSVRLNESLCTEWYALILYFI